MGWPVGKAPQDSNAIHISTASFGVQWKGHRFQQSKNQWACFGKTANAPTAPRSCRGRGKSRWHGTSQSRTRMPTPTSATRPWKQELQPALQKPTSTANYIRNSHLHSSVHWNSRYLAPPGSWAGPGTGKAGDHHHRWLQTDHLPVPAVIRGFAKGERGLVSEQVHSQLACSNQLFAFLNFNIECLRLCAHNNNNNNNNNWTSERINCVCQLGAVWWLSGPSSTNFLRGTLAGTW